MNSAKKRMINIHIQLMGGIGSIPRLKQNYL